MQHKASQKRSGPSRGTLAVLLGLAIPAAWTPSAWALGSCDDPSITSSQVVYGLATNNLIHAIKPGSATRSSPVTGVDGNLIGLDFRVADGVDNRVYGVTDTGKIYLIDLDATPFNATLVSTISPRFAGGYQSLMDFNPAVNALRLIGSNDQNFAVVNNNGGNLNRTVPQTALQYVAGDPNAGVDPNITAGAYDTNVAGAPQTTFYMIDYDLDTFVTIADRNTANGDLQTIGPLVDESGNPINFAPTAGLDIYTSSAGFNVGFAASGQTLYCIDLDSVSVPPVGVLQKVVAQVLPQYTQELARVTPAGGLIDVAVVPFLGDGGAPQADLAVTANDAPDPVRGGQTLTYTIAVRNLGPAPATQVALTSTALPFDENFGINPVPSQGKCNTAGAAGNLLNCQLGTLASGTSATVTVQVQVSPLPFKGAQTVNVTFTGSSAVSDPNTANNSAVAVTTVTQ